MDATTVSMPTGKVSINYLNPLYFSKEHDELN